MNTGHAMCQAAVDSCNCNWDIIIDYTEDKYIVDVHCLDLTFKSCTTTSGTGDAGACS